METVTEETPGNPGDTPALKELMTTCSGSAWEHQHKPDSVSAIGFALQILHLQGLPHDYATTQP